MEPAAEPGYNNAEPIDTREVVSLNLPVRFYVRFVGSPRRFEVLFGFIDSVLLIRFY